MTNPDPETWEARKSAAAHERAERERAAQEKQQPWMGGWERQSGTTILVYPSVCCVCCGRVLGVICFVIDPDWVRPPDPIWPFGQEDCPLRCGERGRDYGITFVDTFDTDAASSGWSVRKGANLSSDS